MRVASTEAHGPMITFKKSPARAGEGMRELAKVRMVGDTAAMKATLSVSESMSAKRAQARVNAADWATALEGCVLTWWIFASK